MTFQKLKEFMESWALHFDTPNGDSNDIPYPEVYDRMRDDADKVLGKKASNFIGSITDTTDGRTYLTPCSWEEIETLYNGAFDGKES